MKYKVDVASNRVKQYRQKLDGLIKIQNDLKGKVSSKSNDTVDIKPGQTIEDIYVSLRRRGKILKGQESKDAPILKAEQKVLLLPERSIRILKEFLVDLKDQDNKTLAELKQENQLLKETGEHLFKKIKEQHERDKVVGAPEENQAKALLKDYEKLLYDVVPEFKEADNQVIELSRSYCESLGKNTALGKEQHALLGKYLEVRRQVNKMRQEVNDLSELHEGIKEIGAERFRKKERAVEKQNQTIQDLQGQLELLAKTNEELAKILAIKEDDLIKLEDSCENFGIKELNPKIEENINNFIGCQKERRQFQDESEDLPPEWDKRFKGFIQDMSTEIKNATTEYPSNKKFPTLINDWLESTNEANETDREIRVLERAKIAQAVKVAMMRDIQNEIIMLRERLNQSK